MKNIVCLLIVVSTILNMVHGQSVAEESATGIAVVELFTSEGCSSCPPADRVLMELVSHHNESGNRVYGLSFHVDYWNRLGWNDPFSHAEFTRRQRVYGEVFRLTSVYTPQVVINGTKQMVGSRQWEVVAAVGQALEKPATATIQLTTGVGPEARTLQVGYRVKPFHEHALLNLALVDVHRSAEVTRGENAGRSLAHANVVRQFRRVRLPASGQGSVAVQVPAVNDEISRRVIAYLQSINTAQIFAAAEADVQISPDVNPR